MASISFGYWKIKLALPPEIRSELENLLGISYLTKTDFKKIENLGLSIGLERNEIRSATSPPIVGTGHMPMTRSTLFNTVICRLLCIIILVAAVIATYFIVANQVSVYTPGAKYGSISPNDFS
ncbi:MAG: hypothetical protein OEV85_08595 [Candidatus Thorarchaeota archaeon]|nr:hypothetical protein [Candidatus Thorarchaeota archaeon]